MENETVLHINKLEFLSLIVTLLSFIKVDPIGLKKKIFANDDEVNAK